MTCPFGTMDWYCCLAAGHAGPHESHELPPDTSTNPPSVPSLDVEAYVEALLVAAGCECADAFETFPVYCIGAKHRAHLRALASALPGMGKALEHTHDPADDDGSAGEIAIADYDEWREFQAWKAARAAQPEETSADERP